MNYSWNDPDAAWWAKAIRARTHIEAVTATLAAYQRPEPFEIMKETDQPGRADYRLRIRERLPSQVLTTIGDALHNLRSCLDSVAFELARQYLGGVMTEQQEAAAQFPISRDPAAFDEFLSRQHRGTIWGDRQIAALRCAQPFALHEEVTAMGAEMATTLGDEYRISEIARLGRLSNLDKHRRLPLLAWYEDMVYGGALREDCTWHRPYERRLSDGGLVGSLTWSPHLPDPSPGFVIVLQLALADDPGYTGDAVPVLAGMHSTITSWILPRIFQVAEGNPPPLAFGRS